MAGEGEGGEGEEDEAEGAKGAETEGERAKGEGAKVASYTEHTESVCMFFDGFVFGLASHQW